MKATKLSAIVCLLCRLVPATLFGQMPQDHWVFNGQLIHTNVIGGAVFGGLVEGADGNIYALAADGSTVNGLTVNFNCSFTTPLGQSLTASAVTVGAGGVVYAIVKPTIGGGAPQVQEFYRNIYQNTYGANSLVNPTALAIGHDGYLYVADSGNSSVEVFFDPVDHRPWTNGLGAANAFPFIASLAQLPDGNFCAAGSFGMGNPPLQVFAPGGLFVTNLNVPQQPANVSPFAGLSVSPDGVVGLLFPNQILAVQPDLGQNPLNSNSVGVAPPSFGQFAGGSAAFDSNGTLYAIVNVIQPHAGTPAGSTAVAVMPRVYGTAQTADAPLSIIPPPAPLITSVQQRPGTTLVDIAYAVQATTPTVTTALVAFQNAVESFPNLVLMPAASFTNNGVNNIGLNVAANVTNTVTWDSSQGITNFASLEFDIMANDQRPLLNIHFITVPPNLTQPALTISSYAYRESDFFNLWLWLLATNNPSIALTNGTVTGVGGAYNQQLLAGTNSSTPAGRQFLYQLLNVRAPTQAEITQAQGGNYGILSTDPNYSLVKLP